MGISTMFKYYVYLPIFIYYIYITLVRLIIFSILLVNFALVSTWPFICLIIFLCFIRRYMVSFNDLVNHKNPIKMYVSLIVSQHILFLEILKYFSNLILVKCQHYVNLIQWFQSVTTCYLVKLCCMWVLSYTSVNSKEICLISKLFTPL